ncbi:MAG: hypothetical protein AAF513_02340 [Pseudomonadota bacterium]
MTHFEFWPPRLFEAPYYLYLLGQCALRGLAPKTLAKANYALDHGELGLGSKYATQMAFEQDYFLPTVLLQTDGATSEIHAQAAAFAAQAGYPLILKPDIGAVGKGIIKVDDEKDLARALEALRGRYLCQQYTPHAEEFGVFYARKQGHGQITGINQKHFPTVIGDGRTDLAGLAAAHPRFTDHWGLFLRYLDTTRVPAAGEVVRLSFVGSHTMGCKFTNDTALATPALAAALDKICVSQPGFNFGRFDLKAPSTAALQEGDFVVIEVNGIASLPTHMFDPAHSVWQAYRIFLDHGKLLAQIADEHRDRSMPLDGYGEIWARAKENHKALDALHADLIA